MDCDTIYSLVGGYYDFGGTHYLHPQGRSVYGDESAALYRQTKKKMVTQPGANHQNGDQNQVEVICCSKTLVSTYTITCHHNPEEYNMNNHRHENTQKLRS
jgi:hypothetical protein